jgi:hypothetical protein
MCRAWIFVDVHLLHALDLAGLYETAELGDGLPFLLLCQLSMLPMSSDAARAYLGLAAAATTSTTTTAATVASTITARSESTTAARCSSVSHVVCDLVGRLRVCAVRNCLYRVCGRRKTYREVFLVLADVATFDGFVGGTNFEVQCVLACASRLVRSGALR